MLLIYSSSVPPEAFDKQSNGVVAHLEAKVESDELDRLNEIARAAVPTKGGGNDEEIGGGDEDENGVGEEEAEDDGQVAFTWQSIVLVFQGPDKSVGEVRRCELRAVACKRCTVHAFGYLTASRDSGVSR